MTVLKLGPALPLYTVEIPPVVTVNLSQFDSVLNATEVREPATFTVIEQESWLL